MIKYEIREICGDWAIYEVREAETEGGERCLLILNSRSNAEYVKAILEHEAKNPNAAVRYFPRAERMSGAEVLAVFRMCATDEVGACDKCPLKGRDVCREEINRWVLEMAEKYLEHRKNIELIRALIETAAECGARMKGGRLEGWINVDKWLEGDELKQNEVNRAITMREKTLRIIENAKTEVAREIFEKIKRSKVTLGHPAKIICFRATPTGEVEEIVESWVVPQSRIEELEKKYTGEQT